MAVKGKTRRSSRVRSPIAVLEILLVRLSILLSGSTLSSVLHCGWESTSMTTNLSCTIPSLVWANGSFVSWSKP